MRGTIISFTAFLIILVMISQLAIPVLSKADDVAPTEIPLEEEDDDGKKQDAKDKLFQITDVTHIHLKKERRQNDLTSLHCFEIVRAVVPPPPKA